MYRTIRADKIIRTAERFPDAGLWQKMVILDRYSSSTPTGA